MKEINICITFDIDFVNYVEGKKNINEFEVVILKILPYFEKKPEIKATWFIRLDNQMKVKYGYADYIFRRYQKEIDYIVKMGHEIAWHPHVFKKIGGKWMQNTEEKYLIEELSMTKSIAQFYRLNSVRLGWGFTTNEIMKFISDQGFIVDSSAIPRPNYRWEESEKNWEGTPRYPYFPSKNDYRLPGIPSLPILEIPMSVAPIRASYDNETVLRVINLAYHRSIFEDSLRQCIRNENLIVTMTHPYEVLINRKRHDLLAFNLKDFESNLLYLKNIKHRKKVKISFHTISSFANYYKESING